MSKLSSTDEFTKADTLSVAERRLLLFLAVTLTDEDGCLTRMYERLLDTYADELGHWVYGKKKSDLHSLVSKWIGKSAMRIPRWDRVVDMLTVALPPDRLDEAFATAAGLYHEITGRLPGDGGYGSDIQLPAWATYAVVTVNDIRGAPNRSGAPHTADGEIPQVPVVAEQPAAAAIPEMFQGDLAGELVRMAKEIDDLRILLANQSRDWRRQDKEIEQLDKENEQLRAANSDLQEEGDARVRQQFIETTKLHQRLNDAVDTSGRVADAFLALLRRLHPHASPDTLKRLAQDEVNAVRDHHRHRGAAIEFLVQRRREPVEMPRWTQTTPG